MQKLIFFFRPTDWCSSSYCSRDQLCKRINFKLWSLQGTYLYSQSQVINSRTVNPLGYLYCHFRQLNIKKSFGKWTMIPCQLTLFFRVFPCLTTFQIMGRSSAPSFHEFRLEYGNQLSPYDHIVPKNP